MMTEMSRMPEITPIAISRASTFTATTTTVTNDLLVTVTPYTTELTHYHNSVVLS